LARLKKKVLGVLGVLAVLAVLAALALSLSWARLFVGDALQEVVLI
jgi:hypothetical protein